MCQGLDCASFCDVFFCFFSSVAPKVWLWMLKTNWGCYIVFFPLLFTAEELVLLPSMFFYSSFHPKYRLWDRIELLLNWLFKTLLVTGLTFLMSFQGQGRRYLPKPWHGLWMFPLLLLMQLLWLRQAGDFHYFSCWPIMNFISYFFFSHLQIDFIRWFSSHAISSYVWFCWEIVIGVSFVRSLLIK